MYTVVERKFSNSLILLCGKERYIRVLPVTLDILVRKISRKKKGTIEGNKSSKNKKQTLSKKKKKNVNDLRNFQGGWKT